MYKRQGLESGIKEELNFKSSTKHIISSSPTHSLDSLKEEGTLGPCHMTMTAIKYTIRPITITTSLRDQVKTPKSCPGGDANAEHNPVLMQSQLRF